MSNIFIEFVDEGYNDIEQSNISCWQIEGCDI